MENQCNYIIIRNQLREFRVFVCKVSGRFFMRIVIKWRNISRKNKKKDESKNKNKIMVSNGIKK